MYINTYSYRYMEVYSNLSEWKAPISPNFQNFVGAPISTNFKMKEAPISPNVQNRRQLDLFFYILSCKNTFSNWNSKLQVITPLGGYFK